MIIQWKKFPRMSCTSGENCFPCSATTGPFLYGPLTQPSFQMSQRSSTRLPLSNVSRRYMVVPFTNAQGKDSTKDKRLLFTYINSVQSTFPSKRFIFFGNNAETAFTLPLLKLSSKAVALYRLSRDKELEKINLKFSQWS